MTEKELHKLRRQDLLQLLLLQSRESAQQQAVIEELKQDAAQLRESNERLKGKLDEKDSQIERLKGRLDQKDVQIRALRAELEALHPGSPAAWGGGYLDKQIAESFPAVKPEEPAAPEPEAAAEQPAEAAPAPAVPEEETPEREAPEREAESGEATGLFKEGSIWQRRKSRSHQLNYWKRS